MFADGLREQAEKLQIPGFVDDQSARLMQKRKPKEQTEEKIIKT